MRDALRERDIRNAEHRHKCEKKIASSERVDPAAADELRARYEDYGIEGETEYWEAMDNEYHYLYGNTFWENEQEREPVYSYSRRLGRHRTAPEEEAWKSQQRELEIQWIRCFDDPGEYLKAFREFIEINALVHEFTIKHTLEDSVTELLAADKRDITCDDAVFLKYYF